MTHNEKRDNLLEDLQERLAKEDLITGVEAVAVLYTAYMSKARKIARDDMEQFMEKVNQAIREE